MAAFIAVERAELANNSVRSSNSNVTVAEAVELCEEGVEESNLESAVIALRERDNAMETEEGLDKDGSADEEEEGGEDGQRMAQTHAP